MKKITVIFFSLLFLLSCGSNNKKKTPSSTPSPNYINVVEGSDGFNAYTEDGHTIIYKTDSSNNNIVYYAKFDDNAGRKGYDRVKDKAIRVAINASLNNLEGFTSVYGGASCKIEDNGGCLLNYFDEQLNANKMEISGFHLDEQPILDGSTESTIKRIIYILSATYDIAKTINERNTIGWNYIVSALEPTQSIANYDVMIQETVYAPKAKEHISKLNSTTGGLTQLYLLFQEKKLEQ